MMKNEMERYIVLILFFFLSIVPFVERIAGLEFGVKFPISSVYVFYMLLGWYLSRSNIQIKKIHSVIIIVVACVLGCVDGFTYIFDKPSIGFASYDSPVIVLMSIVIFLLFKNAGFKGGVATDKVIQTLSKHSFAIYIMHMFWINVIYKLLKFNPFFINSLFGLFISYLGVMAVTYVSCFVMKQIPYLRMII